QAPNAQLRPAAAGYVNRASVAGKNVAGTLDAEIHVTIHESGLIPPHHAVAVGEAADVIGGGQLDQRNSAAGFFIDDCDFKVGRWNGCGAARKRQQQNEQANSKPRDSAKKCGSLHSGFLWSRPAGCEKFRKPRSNTDSRKSLYILAPCIRRG